MMRIRSVFVLGTMLLALTASAAEPETGALSQRIDDAIQVRLKSENLKAVARADNARLVRRLYLDLLGRVPTTTESETFLADTTADKIHRLIDRLLVHPEMPVFWRKVLDGWFNDVADRAARRPGHEEFLSWLEKSLASNKPWDRLARELIVPDAKDPAQRGASFFLTSRLQGEKSEQLDNITTSVTASLFGVQLQCAKCHDHPFVTEWKQDHYYGMGAVFNRLEAKNEGGQFVLNDKAGGEVKFLTDKKEEKTAAALFLDNVVLDRAFTGKGSNPNSPVNRRQKLADHALKAESPYFKRSLVNRVWKQLLGRGFIEPVDQMYSANPASHPELLDALADDFAGKGFDLRRLMSAILHSETYLRDSRYSEGKRPADDLYAAAILRPLSGEQMAWSLVVATGYTDQLTAKFARDLKPAPAKGELSPALRVRWERDQEFDPIASKFRSTGESFQANVSQALFVTFNPFAQKLLQPVQGNLVQRLVNEKDNTKAVRMAYLAILSRPSRAEDTQDVVPYLESAQDRKQACIDLVWALLTSAEFRFNH